MSMSALLRATRDQLWEKLALTPDQCSVRLGGKPPQVMGDQFIAVHATSIGSENPTINQAIDQNFAVTITLTHRTAWNPYSNNDDALLETTALMEAELYRVIQAIHGAPYEVLSRANRLLTGNNLFIEPLRFQNMDAEPVYVGGEWFVAEGEVDPNDRFDALVQTMRFDGARRMQSLTNLVSDGGMIR